MTYWGSKPEECDFAYTSVGANIGRIKKQMLEDMKDNDGGEPYPEQSILSSLVCLRLLGERFPGKLISHFGRQDFENTKVAFYEWYELVKRKIPTKFRAGLLEEAEREFQLFEQQIFNR